jgi:hypothetical protein
MATPQDPKAPLPSSSESAGAQLMDAKATPVLKHPEAEAFYIEALTELTQLGTPYLLAGTYALSAYTGISRPTKDLDIFCKAGDYPRILAYVQERGYGIGVEDERWIAKLYDGKYFVDVIFSVRGGDVTINDEWFEDAPEVELYGTHVRITKPTQLIWSKMFMQDRYRYDGADVAHVILKQHEAIDWHKLLSGMELHWEVLLSHLINFRFAYPTERDCVPRWLMQELIGRLQAQVTLPPAKVRVCRGRLFSPRDYVTDITEWGFADVVGKGLEERHDPIP